MRENKKTAYAVAIKLFFDILKSWCGCFFLYNFLLVESKPSPSKGSHTACKKVRM